MGPAARDVVVTGMGATSAVGEGCGALWSAIANGRGGIAEISRFPTADFSVHTGALVPIRVESVVSHRNLTGALCRRFATVAAREALRDANLTGAHVAAGRVALVFATGLGKLDRGLDALAAGLAEALEIRGPCITVSTACSSSTGAIGLARDLIGMGAADVVLAGGADVLSPEVFAGFHALGVLSPARCAPFSFPFGTTLGEGAGFVVLERSELARDRGARVRATLGGYGLSADAWHETSPDPRGAGIERAVLGALDDARLTGTAIGYVNVHGSGTEANDPAEWSGLRRALGQHAQSIPVSSSKGHLGHAQGAAGALETIVTILAMEHAVVPPTLNFTRPRPLTPPDPVGAPLPRPAEYRHALCLNAAFGGANVALVLSRPDGPLPPRVRAPVAVLGFGMVGPWGAGHDTGRAMGGAGPGHRDVPRFELSRILPNTDTRGLDPTAQLLTAAAALALRDAGVAVRGRLRDRTGLVVGQTQASPASVHAFRESIEERGLSHLCAPAFARIVLNAAAGACSKLLSLRGPLTVLTTGAGSGLAAVAFAAEMLSTRQDADLMLAGGVDERDETAHVDRHGAVCALLGGPGFAQARPPCARVLGWGIGPSDGLQEAVALALASAGISPSHIAHEFRAPSDPGAAPSVLAAADGVLALQRGTTRPILITADGRGSASIALVLGPPTPSQS